LTNNKKRLSFGFSLWGLLVICASLFCSAASCQSLSGYNVEVAFPSLKFNQPDAIVSEPNGTRLFVLEQTGIVRVFNNTQNVDTTKVFLDISDRVLYGGEQGLLGIAFHPDFNQNHYFYVDYVADNPRRTVIARFTANDDLDAADVNSQKVILEINQPFSNHNGGQLAFGPEGYLYIGMGDGGSAGDPMGNGQNLTTLLGKILRIDVNSSSGERNYEIPNDNPYFGNNLGYREEIYAYGFRNPWRFSFDPVTGDLWVGDVGQDRLEEIDVVAKGKNYGWGIMEGSSCYNPSMDCNQTGIELPVWNYTHDVGSAVIGGFVYRGPDLADLYGSYVYGDYGSGRIWALKYDGTTVENTLLADTALNIASFGVDQQNELFFTAYNGKVYKLTSTIIPEVPSTLAAVFMLATTVIIVLTTRVKKNRRRREKVRNYFIDC
jgi:glucose/arabinose dehydrogenase